MDPQLMDVFAVVLAAGVGVLVGPWLTEIVERAPNEDRVRVSLRPAMVAVIDRDRRRTRDRAIRVLAPLVLALAAVRWGWSIVVVPYVVLYAALLVLSMIDVEHHRLPDNVVFPTLGITTALVVAISAVLDGPSRAVPALIGAAVYLVVLAVPWFIYPKGLGFGDVKLASVLGLMMGWIYGDAIYGVVLIMYSLLISCVIGVVVGIGVSIAKRKRAEFPFGPALAIGCATVITFSDAFIRV